MNAALIFPGQGSQKVGMGKDLYDHSEEAKAVFDAADKGIDGLSDVIFNGPEEKLKQTAYCQPAIFTTSVAALKAFQASDKYAQVTPVLTCGHSLGEYAALVACGALDLEKGLALVQKRSQYMEEATQLESGAMAAVIGLDADIIKGICETSGAQMANFNAPDQIVITGAAGKVAEASSKIKEAGAKRVIPLPVSGAFHSSLMQSAADKFVDVIAEIEISTPTFPVLSNVDATPTMDPAVIGGNLSKQIVSSVLWVDTINAIASEGVTTFIEIGPGNVLKGLLRKINRDLTVHNIQTSEDITNLEL